MCQYYSYSPDLKVAIVGRCKDTVNYEKALQAMDVGYIVYRRVCPPVAWFGRFNHNPVYHDYFGGAGAFENGFSGASESDGD